MKSGEIRGCGAPLETRVRHQPLFTYALVKIVSWRCRVSRGGRVRNLNRHNGFEEDVVWEVMVQNFT